MRDRGLTSLFLRHLLDHDLLSPHTDRRQALAAGVAAMISLGLVVTVILGLRYVLMPFPSPGRTAVLAVTDLVLYTGLSLLTMALIAVAQWDAFSLDARDASILGPLPIPAETIVRAKMAAVGIFAAGALVALNGIPILMHPLLMVGRLPIGPDVFLRLVGAHALATIAAGVCGFLAVLGLRELLRLTLGATRGTRAPVVVQTVLVFGLGALLLLLPAAAGDIARGTLTASGLTAPLLGFVGLWENVAGPAMDRLPAGSLPGFSRGWEAEALALYRTQRAALQPLGSTALIVVGVVTSTALVTYGWNMRRWSSASSTRSRAPWRGLRAMGGWIGRRFLVRHPVARAGFFFTLQVLFRSPLHRLALAVSLAAGGAVAMAILRGVNTSASDGLSTGLSSVPVGLLAVQTILLVAVAAGLQHAVRVPAELRSNWTFLLAFTGNERRYLSGVRRAAFFAVVLPLVAVLLPAHAAALGWLPALVHAAWGSVVGLVLIECSLLGFRKLPFVVPYMPTGHLKTWGLPLAMIAVVLAYGLAWLERLASSTEHVWLLLAAGWMLALVLHNASVRRCVETTPDLDGDPLGGTQRLGLSGD